VLSGLETLKVAVAYEDESGRRFVDFPSHLADLERVRPVYETLPGWPEDITGARTWEDLPKAARDYVDFLERQVNVPISIVSVGPDRTQTIPRPLAESR
jgi:adenylosuccinate synthase